MHAGSIHLCGKSHATRDKKATAGYPCGHHAELLLLDKGDEVLDLLGQLWVLEVLCGVRVGGLVAGVCVAERHVVVVFCDKGA